MIELRAGVDSGLEGIEIRHREAVPEGYLFSWIFESVGGASFLYPWDVLRPRWEPLGDGAWGYRLDPAGNSEHPIRIVVRLVPASSWQLELEAVLVNLSDRTFSYSWADICLMFKNAPSYPDSEGERCLVDTRNGPRPAALMPRAIREDAWSRQVQAFRVRGVQVPYPYRVVQGLALWSISPEVVRSGCIMMARSDREWHIGLMWDRSATVAHNPDAEHHCIHSAPWFGTLHPREHVTRRGAILFVHGSAAELLHRHAHWKKTTQQGGSQ